MFVFALFLMSMALSGRVHLTLVLAVHVLLIGLMMMSRGDVLVIKHLIRVKLGLNSNVFYMFFIGLF